MIETQRLVLLPLTYPQVLKYLRCDNSLEMELKLSPFPRTISPDLVEALENTILPSVADPSKNYLFSTLWTAFTKSDRVMVGDLCFFGEPDANGNIDLGYGTHEAFQGKGFMTEMINGIITWAKSQATVTSITASTNTSNRASISVLKKNGFLKTDETNQTVHWKLPLHQRKVMLFIAMSLDGFIAKPDDDLDFLSMVAEEGQDYGYADFISSVDTVIVGRKTYDKVLSMGIPFPHADKDTYVITRSPRPNIGSIQFYTGSLQALVHDLKTKTGKHIYCDGGADIVNELLHENLIDDLIISVIPILLGNGIPLFKKGRPEQALQLIAAKSFEKGLTQLHYRRPS
jgi:dihydrofolate reductase/RimJ/RimL family protein N-acetyltransferase